MFPSKLPVFRSHFFVSLLAIVVVLAFSSWGASPGGNIIRITAGDAAFSRVVTTHTLQIKALSFTYQTTAAYQPVTDGNGHTAQIFYTAYHASGDSRPVTFIFNGGPGSSSIWLHMGSVAPVRVVPGVQGYKNNPNTWLPFTDMIFIDPVGTGYSRPENIADSTRFYGYQADLKIIAGFIISYLNSTGQRNAKVYLAGESYGAARAVGLAAYLRDTLAINVAGLNLISPALNYKLVTFRKGNNAPYPYYLSAFAAAAQFHHRLPARLQSLSLQQLQARVNAFAYGSYSRFLYEGKHASEVLDSLSYFTGINRAALQKLHGRLTDIDFTRLLPGTTGERTGTFDSREEGSQTADPSEQKLRTSFPQAFDSYNADVLGYKNNLPYLATIATPTWDYGTRAPNAYLNVLPVLKNLLTKHPEIKVHVVGGYYDLATPAATIKATIAALGSKTSRQVTMKIYRAGHMIYTDDTTNAQWKTDAELFYKAVLTANDDVKI